MTFDQSGFAIRCEWGARGLAELVPTSDVIVIVDVLSFTTAVDVATARGASVFPYPLKDDSAARYADSMHAELASPDRTGGYSLSPQSLLSLPHGCRLVLPSPNGPALAYRADHPVVFAACLRNVSAVARAAASLGEKISVIPSGERWETDELRPCLEDWIGAGAVISDLPGTRSPEAELAASAFVHFRDGLPDALRATGAGRELIERGFEADVEIAAAWNVSHSAPRLISTAFTAL